MSASDEREARLHFVERYASARSAAISAWSEVTSSDARARSITDILSLGLNAETDGRRGVRETRQAL